MEKFRITRNDELLATTESLVSEGKNLGIDVVRLGLPQKLEGVKKSVEGDISIVLLGGFSDGKTSAIAGFSGVVFDDIKIDTDESSDQLEVYDVPGNAGFKFVDTPGLFGTKEREIDGASVRYSKITERYISEAHIVVYLCDAGVPLKESHVPVIRKVLRDLGKLKSAVFVLNKMDEAGFYLTDEEDFRAGCEIKKNALIKRLEDTIGLTEKEKARLRIVCIAAAPKGKGLEYWLADENRAEAYKRRSHIDDFRKAVQEVVDETDEVKLRTDTMFSGVKDVLCQLKEGLSVIIDPLRSVFSHCTTGTLDKLSAALESELEKIRDDLSDELKKKESSLKSALEGVGDISGLESVLNRLGMDGEKVDLGNIRKDILGMLSDAKRKSEKQIEKALKDFEREEARQRKALEGGVKGSKENLQLAIGSSEALGVLSGFSTKFKMPTDWAKLITGVGGALGIGSGGATAAIAGVAVAAPVFVAVSVVAGIAAGILKWRKSAKEKQLLLETVPKVCNGIEELFRYVSDEYCGDAFYEKLAPGYKELCAAIDGHKAWLEEKKSDLAALEAYGKKLEAELPKLEAR